jgi:hypothetical protein
VGGVARAGEFFGDGGAVEDLVEEAGADAAELSGHGGRIRDGAGGRRGKSWGGVAWGVGRGVEGKGLRPLCASLADATGRRQATTGFPTNCTNDHKWGGSWRALPLLRRRGCAHWDGSGWRWGFCVGGIVFVSLQI